MPSVRSVQNYRMLYVGNPESGVIGRNTNSNKESLTLCITEPSCCVRNLMNNMVSTLYVMTLQF